MVMLLSILCAFLLLPGVLGLLVIYHVLIRGKQSPADKSNRINHIRLLWFAMTREDVFVGTFPWLKHDEMDNVS